MIEEKKQFIEGLQAGEKVKSTFLITKKDTKKDKNNKYFCDLELQDMTGVIPGKIWSESISSTDINSFKKRDVVSIEGEVNESDKFGKQINIKSIVKVDEKNIDYFFINKKIDDKTLQSLIAELKNYISDIKNSNIRTLLDSFFNDDKFFEKFCSATAAIKNHHAAVGGLLLHSVSVARICKFIAETYGKSNKLIDEDVLFCGSILHDVGKTDSYSVGMTIGINEEEENLVSHISLGYGMILMKMEKINDFPENLKREILQIILSHHGVKEYGSPVEPQTLEAIIVYNADRFDADIDHYANLAAESPE
ncbi:MAG: HD domain-containing protein, partial [Actinobacteria bacterium]|nr:HD domain-containing protein [Actinomycetota bacterium]